ncbi:hypothetical protein XPA_000277 [Xanthoria parietina]
MKSWGPDPSRHQFIVPSSNNTRVRLGRSGLPLHPIHMPFTIISNSTTKSCRRGWVSSRVGVCWFLAVPILLGQSHIACVTEEEMYAAKGGSNRGIDRDGHFVLAQGCCN